MLVACLPIDCGEGPAVRRYHPQEKGEEAIAMYAGGPLKSDRYGRTTTLSSKSQMGYPSRECARSRRERWQTRRDG